MFAVAALPLSVLGTAGDDIIQIDAADGSLTDVMVTVNGKQTGPFRPDGPIRINGLAGNDVLTVNANVYLPTIIDGGPGQDKLSGGSGDDQFQSRDGEKDTTDGGLGLDQAATDSLDEISGIETVNPLTSVTDNTTQHVKVLVINYDPLVPSEGNQHLYNIFGWNNPRDLAAGYKSDLERDSGGAVQFDIVQWRDLNEFPAFSDGYRYDADQYVQNRRTNSGWHDGQIDFPRMAAEQGLTSLVDSGAVDEVWYFGDHFFIPVIGESWMAGPGSFFINGPTFPQVPSHRAFACMGFSYERGVAEMIHDTGHRTESTMNRAYGGWNLEHPTSNWDRFSANNNQSNGVAGVGTTHWPANAEHDYDTFDERVVQSWADDYLNYPTLTGATTPVNRQTWAKGDNPDYERSYQNWYFTHLPRAPGLNLDGHENNWWKYLYDFNDYTPDGKAKPLSAAAALTDVYVGGSDQAAAVEHTYAFSVAYSGAVPVDISTLGDDDVVVTGPGGYSSAAHLVNLSDATNDSYVVATYEVIPPSGFWKDSDRGVYSIQLQNGTVKDVAGSTLPATTAGAFNVRGAAAAPLANDADTGLLLHFDQSVAGAAGESPLSPADESFVAGKVKNAVQLGVDGQLVYPQAANISAAEGTVEFWIKPNWNADGTDHTFFQVGDPFNNGMLLAIDGANNLRFIRWGDDLSTPTHETSYERGVGWSGSDWTAGKWYHFAATWNGSTHEMSLYINGQLVGTEQAVSIPAFSHTEMSIGSRYDGLQPSNASFDEFRISTRARPAGEITADYAAGLSVVGIAVDPATAALTVGIPQRFTASATLDNGQRLDVTHQVRWDSSNPSIASVESDGTVTPTAAGAASITANLNDAKATSTVSVTAVADKPTVQAIDFVDADQGFGRTTQHIQITYAGIGAVGGSDLGTGDIRVHGPHGFSIFPRLEKVVASGAVLVATYQFTPPGGYWDGADDGTYQLELKSFQVQDGADYYAEASDSLASIPVAVSLAPSWHNLRSPLDVNGDDIITPIDALIVINYLNSMDSENLSDRIGDLPFYIDTDGDGYVSPIDALYVINYLNSPQAHTVGEYFTQLGAANGDQMSAVPPIDAPVVSDELLMLLAADVASDNPRHRLYS